MDGFWDFGLMYSQFSKIDNYTFLLLSHRTIIYFIFYASILISNYYQHTNLHEHLISNDISRLKTPTDTNTDSLKVRSVTVPFRSIRHVTRHRPQSCVENWLLSQVTKASVEGV